MSESLAGGRSYPPKPSDVYLFATCLVDQFAPQVGVDTVTLLEREGIRVHYPEQQTCFGQPALQGALRLQLQVCSHAGFQTKSDIVHEQFHAVETAFGIHARVDEIDSAKELL